MGPKSAVGPSARDYCPASDGFFAARIEEKVVVTDQVRKVIAHFPAEDLPIANAYS